MTPSLYTIFDKETVKLAERIYDSKSANEQRFTGVALIAEILTIGRVVDD